MLTKVNHHKHILDRHKCTIILCVSKHAPVPRYKNDVCQFLVNELIWDLFLGFLAYIACPYSCAFGLLHLPSNPLIIQLCNSYVHISPWVKTKLSSTLLWHQRMTQDWPNIPEVSFILRSAFESCYHDLCHINLHIHDSGTSF